MYHSLIWSYYCCTWAVYQCKERLNHHKAFNFLLFLPMSGVQWLWYYVSSHIGLWIFLYHVTHIGFIECKTSKIWSQIVANVVNTLYDHYILVTAAQKYNKTFSREVKQGVKNLLQHKTKYFQNGAAINVSVGDPLLSKLTGAISSIQIAFVLLRV